MKQIKLKRKRTGWFTCVFLANSSTPAMEISQYAYELFSLAWDHAYYYHHHVLSTLHLLAGLLDEIDSHAYLMLCYFDIDMPRFREEVDAWLEAQIRRPPTRNTVGFRTELAYSLAADEAFTLQHPFVTTGHLLMGILREGLSPANGLLQRWNVDVENAQFALQAAMKHGQPASIG